MWRRNFGRRFIIFLGLLAVSIIGTLVARADSPTSPPGFQVFGQVNGHAFPITVGSVITQGRMDGELCVFDQEFGVDIHVTEEDVAPIVAWRLDDQCRVVVTSIDQPTQT